MQKMTLTHFSSSSSLWASIIQARILVATSHGSATLLIEGLPVAPRGNKTIAVRPVLRTPARAITVTVIIDLIMPPTASDNRQESGFVARLAINRLND